MLSEQMNAFPMDAAGDASAGMLVERLRTLLPDAGDEALLLALLEQAEGAILCCTGRRALPEALRTAQTQLAAVYFNRMGMEGETARGEGSVTRTAEPFPEAIRRQIAPYRLARLIE